MRYTIEEVKIGNRNYKLEYDNEKDTLRYYTPNGYVDLDNGTMMLILGNRVYSKIKLKTAEQVPERF